jgi:HAD superfamily phosphoserine phosphatase-like hydrolase
MKVFIFDFDGTIATKDTTDLILEMPSKDQIWQIEEEWKEGKITSYQCMRAQARYLKGITVEDVQQYLKQHSNVDPYFSKLVHFLKTENFHTVVLSEGYDISLNFHEVQKHIEDIHCSKLLTKNGTLTGELLVLNEKKWNYNTKCLGCCICKVDFLLQLSKQYNVTQSFAVGDGRSDDCLFQYVDVSFSLNPKYKATHQIKDLSAVIRILRKNMRKDTSISERYI